MQRSLAKRLWYNFLRACLRMAFLATCRMRVRGQENEPRHGGALVLSNHQSHLDPMLIGISFRRRMNYLARKTLFDFAPLRWLIRSLDAIPIDREGVGLSGLKETLQRLKRGEMVLLFPEGTRTHDGEVAPLKPGFVALARRGKVPLLPVAVDGAFDAWPRTKLFPRPATINIQIGQPITTAELADYTDEALIAELERRIRCCQRRARQAVRRGDGHRCAARTPKRRPV